MAKITYLLGAGASYQSCPILNKQAEAMIFVAKNDTIREGKEITHFKFENYKELDETNSNKECILWYIGYFGKKALEFGTIDTYAKKLDLQGATRELNLLKMSVSVFFDLWENFYETRYSFFESKVGISNGINLPPKINAYTKIDKRFISLFSIFLERNGHNINFRDSVNFLTWNYDLQLEETFKLFTSEIQGAKLDTVNHYFPFKKQNIDDGKVNKIYHLNGHRGYYDYDKISEGGRRRKGTVDTIQKENYEEFWALHKDLYVEVERKKASYNKFIHYAWEHNLEDKFFDQITKVLDKTEILIIIGYSFPLFNREVDEFLMSKINNKNIREIVYQDPNANLEILNAVLPNEVIGTLGKDEKIKVKKKVNQFYIPNNFNQEFPEKNPLI